MNQPARTSSSMLIVLCGVTLTLIAFAHIASAQTTSPTDGNTPLGLSPGAAAGSYPLSDLDQIGLFNGDLSFKLPIMHIGGRGAAGYTVMLQPGQQSLKWRVQHQIWQSCGQNGCTVTGHSYYPTQNWWAAAQPGYSPGVVVGRKSGENPSHPPGCPIGLNLFYSSLSRITFTSADGTEYELRDQRLGGQSQNRSNGCSSQGALRGKVFVSGDGSSVTFISDTDVYDSLDSYPTTFYPSGYLLFRDGTRYRIDSGGVSWIRDRNGSQVTLSGGTGVTTITDSLQRSVSLSYSNPDVISFKGYGGAARTIQISRASLSTVLRPCRSDPGYQCFSPQTYQQLFPALDGSSYSTFNPSVISAVTLPDGRQYRFSYNSYGELARVDLPTGGTIEYDYASGNPSDSSGVISGSYPADPYTEKAIYRRIVERRVYPDGNTLESKTTYSIDFNPTVVDHLTPAGQLLGREKHYFYGSPTATFFTGANSYPTYSDGREYKTEMLDSDGTTVLRRVENDWQQGCAVSQWSNTVPNNPLIADTTSTLEPTGANQVSKQTFNYDCYNNITDTYEYDYGTGSPATSFTRHTHTDYLTTNPINGAAYDVLNPNATSPDINATFHIRNLSVQQSVYDVGGVERARTSYEYDNYASDTNHAVLQPRSGISGLCTIITSPTQCDNSNPPGFVQRGNATGITRYLLVNGSVTGSISAYGQFDVAGNAVKAIDARGSATTMEYDDRFGAPDGEARSNSAPSELAGLTSYAFITKVTNALGQVTYGKFDYYLGRPVDGEDANGVVSSGYYNDSLDRPTQVVRAANQDSSVKSQTTFSYDDTNHIVTSTSDQNTYNDPNPLKNQVLSDAMGRTIESRQYEGGTNYIAVQIQYDALGRAYKTSNPFRSYAGEQAIWTTTGFDALSRVTSVTTPDSAVVNTSYSGNAVTVTDQTSKARKSVTDGLGRLSSLYEDPNGLSYQTSYSYDVLDDLTTVSQGSQTRTFVYDSLKKLSSATNPESGTVSYQYDNNGNLTQKTDARGVVTTFGTYDSLNRPTTKTYSEGTPSVTYAYDTATNGKGRLASVSSSVSTYSYNSYDALGRALSGNETLGSQTYSLSYSYDLAGQVTGMIYPSGRTVSYVFDGAGRTSSVTGNLGDGNTRTYSTGINYSPFGGMTKEQFGTSTAVYNKLFYDSRGQLSEIRDSTTSPTDTSWNRGAIINHYSNNCWGMCGGSNSTTSMTDNNGNLKKQEVYIPNDDQSYDNYAQFYDYDSLNRLSSVRENKFGGAVNWQQAYIYDRWGNRTIDQTNTWGSGIPKPNFGVDTSTNRLTAPGGYTMSYDSAGNLNFDNSDGIGGTRTYDAENRMKQAWANSQWQTYTYDGDGHRVKRNVNGTETWQIYGLGGELLAEYAANAGASSPQKEYGYRNGQLLVTAEPSAQIHWLVTDQLGTPRMILDLSGNLNAVSRHDYLPFGEELYAGIDGRLPTQGYTGDSSRQKFTKKERDNETGLDWFGPGRYYSSTQGRFTSVDPSGAGAQAVNPQSLNRYTYTLNRPTIAIDPDGLSTIVVSVTVPANGGNPTADVIFFGKIGENGTDVGVRYDGLAAGQGRDRMTTDNDTPYGVYSFDGTQGGTADSRLGRGFGTGKVIISGEAGEIIDSGRSLIRLHGGGSALGDHAYDLNQELRSTQGCVRMHNGDVNELIGYIGTARNNQDPLDRVFIGSATALNTMANQTDRNGSYVNPDLRLAMGMYGNDQERQALVTADANRRAEVQRQREEQQQQQRERQRERQRRRHPENQQS